MEKAPDAHRTHVARFLKHLAPTESDRGDGVPAFSEEEYLGAVEDEWLWELVGLRLYGHPSLVLALAQFRRQARGGQPHGRVSLVQYLTSPSRPQRPDEVPPPSGVLALVPVPTSQDVPTFLREARKGHLPPVTWLDRSAIQMAFDFRPENPSDQRRARGEGGGQHRRFRTMDGHLLEARAEELHAKLHRDLEYVALVDGVQRTPEGSYILPTLIVRRAYLAAEWSGPEQASTDESFVEWKGEAPLFSTRYANPQPLLW